MKILDWYILKRYFATFGVLMLLFVPIGITANLAEKFDKIKVAPGLEIALYFVNFTIFFANMLFPIMLFLSIIWFTSKLASNTEIIAFLSSGVSFWRFLRPYTIGAIVITVIALALSTYIAPAASKGYNEFVYTYLKNTQKEDKEASENIFRQINENEFIYTSKFNKNTKSANNFLLEHFDGHEMTFKITATSIKYKPEDSTYTLNNYKKRIITAEGEDILESSYKKDTTLPFEFEALTPVTYVAETLNFSELKEFIKQQKLHGSSNINRYKVEAYRRWSVPISAFILTIIAVSVSSIKRRGGIGVNLAVGISVAFLYVFLDKIFGTLAEKSSFSPLLAVWIPNIFFGVLAIFLLQKAKR